MPFQNFTNLTYYGVNSLGRNFYLSGENGLRLGCWLGIDLLISNNFWLK